MKERKPLFPEYIWMFFVGLLLAIIVCMRLLPGQAAFYEEPQLNNVIYVRIAGKTLYFGDTDCDPATAVINENGSTWTDALISDINYNLVLLNAKFGVGNFSVFIIDDYAVTYCYEKLAALLYANNIYCYGYVSEVQTGTTTDGEPYTIWASPWNYSYAQTYWTQYYNYNTFILSDFTIGYYTQIDEYVSPTPSLSPSPTPEPELAFSFFVQGKPYFSNSLLQGTGYYMFDVFASDIYSTSLDVPLSTSNVALSTAISNYSVSSPWVRPAVVHAFRDNYYGDFCYAFYFAGSLSSVKVYYIGSVLPTYSKDVIRDSYSAIDIPLDTNVNSTVYAGSSSGLNVVALAFQGKSFDLFDLDLLQYGFYDMGSTFFNSYPGTLFNYDSSSLTNPLVQGYHVGLTNSPIEDITPTPSPTPEGWEPTATPSATPVPETVVVILPSPTPGPTAPVSFNDSDLPGGASGAGGSISSNDGASSSTADGVYNYWSYVLSQNQALAFIASFFQILPFELVYSLGSLIFILILIAMARLFIHFIE